MIIMNLGVPMRFRLRSDDYIGIQIMFLSLRKLWPQVLQQQLLALFQQVEMPLAVKPLQVVELLRVVVQGHPLVVGPCI
jgi:hypothetical protein